MKYIYIVLFATAVAACGGGGGGGGSDSSISINKASQQGFYYSFDSSGASVADDSGNGHTATGVSISRVPGKKGTAIQFLSPGSTLEVVNPNAAFPQKEILTVMAWVKSDHAFSVREQIIGGWTGGNPNDFYPINNFGVSLINNKLSFEVSSYPGATSFSTNTLPITANEWFHIAATYNGSTIKLYYNGQLSAQASLISTFKNSFSNQVGNNYYVFSGVHHIDQFYGALDELYVETKVRSDSEILDYYNSTK